MAKYSDTNMLGQIGRQSLNWNSARFSETKGCLKCGALVIRLQVRFKVNLESVLAWAPPVSELLSGLTKG